MGNLSRGVNAIGSVGYDTGPRYGLVFSALISLVLSQASVAQNSEAPNIILIVADYMGYADIEPYGAKDIRTPALKSLADAGTRFTSFYSAAPKCVPARAALLSGKYPSKVLSKLTPFSKSQGLRARDNILVAQLKAGGYNTAMIGKWHLGSGKNFKPTDHGFDSFLGFDDWTLGYHNHLTSNGEPGLLRDGMLVNETGYLTELFSDEAVRVINSSDSPFFIYLSYNTGLPPYQRPNMPESEWDSGWDVNEASRADYVAMVESMDSSIARVLHTLQQRQIEENTLVIFTYDHGGRHLVDAGPLFHGFGTLWEGGIRVPMIMRWPNKVASSKTASTPAIAMDLTATMLFAAGRKIPNGSLDGINLLPLSNASAQASHRSFFWRSGKMKAVRHVQWKYIIDGHTQLLFDLDSDIGERRNVFAEYQPIATQLRGKLADWEASLD
ncbi:MAG: sulfatase-like hydrolase/transferase [Pseudomonadota bacterium]